MRMIPIIAAATLTATIAGVSGYKNFVPERQYSISERVLAAAGKVRDDCESKYGVLKTVVGDGEQKTEFRNASGAVGFEMNLDKIFRYFTEKDGWVTKIRNFLSGRSSNPEV